MIGAILQPALGILGDSGRRRVVVLTGGLAFGVTLGLFAAAPAFPFLLAAAILGSPASGAFAGLAHATLMDEGGGAYELTMTRWAIAGELGAILGPLALAGFAVAGLGWRALLMTLAVAAVPMVWWARTVPFDRPHLVVPWHQAARGAWRALRKRAVMRWLILLELSDLLGDTLLSYVALYLVDVGGASVVQGGIAVAVFTGATLVGNTLLPRVLVRVGGDRYLRTSAWAVAAVFPLFLVVPAVSSKIAALGLMALIRAGWYPVTAARVFEQMEGSSGAAVGLADLATLPARLLPVAIGAAAGAFGLGWAMWLLLAAPAALLIGVPRVSASRTS